MALSPKEEAVLDLIQQDETYENYFFKKVEAIKWFYPLKEKGFFAREKASAPQLADKEGFFIIPQWNILPYLEKVSQQANEPGNEKYIDELLAIIKDVSLYKDSNGHYIDNYRTWWFFVKILINIPPEKIPIEIIDLIPIWLDSKFDTTLLGADILNKLIPKFLKDGSTEGDIKKAEKMIEYTTAIRPVPREEETSFGDEGDKYKTVIDSHWLVEAFKKYSGHIGEKCSAQVIYDLAGVKKIKLLLKRKESKIPVTINSKTYLFVLNDDEKDYIVTVRKIEGKTEMDVAGEILAEQETAGDIIAEERLEKCDKNVFLAKLYNKLTNEGLLVPDEPDVLKRNLRNLFSNLHDKGTYHSFYEEQKYFDRDPLELFTFMLKGTLIAKAKSASDANIAETKTILQNFFKENYLFFTKMAFYVIGHYIERYGDLFWEALETDTEDIILDDVYFGDELKHLLSNLKSLTEQQRKLLKQKIDSSLKGYEIEEGNEAYLASLKQQWYEALSFDPKFKSLYEEMKEITKRDAQLGPAMEMTVTWEGPGPSALQQEDILQKTNVELAQFLATFEEKDSWHGPTVRGLAELFKQAVQDKPDKFVDDLKPFLNTGYLYMYYMFWGLRDAWANKKDFDWQKFFNFIKEYLKRDEFWSDRLQIIGERGWRPKHENVIGEISQLIQEGTRDDARAFPDTLFEDAKKILWLILDRLAYTPEPEGGYGDYVTHALNSAWGKAVSAFIYLALRIVRVNDKKGEKKEIKWDEDYRQKYNTLLGKDIIEAYTWLGHYLPQLYYIDKEWAKEKVTDLDPRKEKRPWEAFMNGYLYSGRVYEDIYELMRPHYEYGIHYDFKESHDRERLIQHISIGYLRGQEAIEDSKSLFRKVLDKWNYQQIREIISYFWMQRDYATTETEDAKNARQKIIEFWKWVFERYQNKKVEQLDKNDKLLLSDISKLIVFLPEINDDNFQWLMLSAPYVKEDFSSPFFIEYLDGLKERCDNKAKTAEYIGEIFLTMLDHFTPDYDVAHIRPIVEFLYEAKATEKAIEICNTYGSRGYEFLRDIYEKNNTL
jgi:hypothetical protein